MSWFSENHLNEIVLLACFKTQLLFFLIATKKLIFHGGKNTSPTTSFSVPIRNSTSPKEIWFFSSPMIMIKCPILFWHPRNSEPNSQSNFKQYRISWPISTYYLPVLPLFSKLLFTISYFVELYIF